MVREFLGVELLELYRRLREAQDPAVKAVIRRRIDSRLSMAGAGPEPAPRPTRPARASYDTGAD